MIGFLRRRAPVEKPGFVPGFCMFAALYLYRYLAAVWLTSGRQRHA
jgi:hypothetical protein